MRNLNCLDSYCYSPFLTSFLSLSQPKKPQLQKKALCKKAASKRKTQLKNKADQICRGMKKEEREHVMKMMPPSIQNPKFILALVLRKTALQVVPPMSHHHPKKKQSSFRFHATKELFLFSSQKIWNLPYCFPRYDHLSPHTNVTDKCHVGSTRLTKWTYHVVPHFFRMDNI